MADIKKEIIEKVGVIGSTESGWRTELNVISWNDGAAKYDLRPWSPDNTKCGKGITLTPEELYKLKELLNVKLGETRQEEI